MAGVSYNVTGGAWSGSGVERTVGKYPRVKTLSRLVLPHAPSPMMTSFLKGHQCQPTRGRVRGGSDGRPERSGRGRRREGGIPADDILGTCTRHGQCQEDRDSVADTPRKRLRIVGEEGVSVPGDLGSGIGLSVGGKAALFFVEANAARCCLMDDRRSQRVRRQSAVGVVRAGRQ